MAKKPNKGDNQKGIDADLIRHFMLGGTEIKDSSRPVNSKPHASVDLHLDETSKEYDLLSNSEKLNAQIAHLEKQIDTALANGSTKIDVIHGKGEGKLKEVVAAFLKKHPRVKSFRLLTDKKHDGGATEVFFK